MQAQRRARAYCGGWRRPAVYRGRQRAAASLRALVRLPVILAIVAAARTVVPARAFDDHDICVLAEQLAVAEEKDVGVWIDRLTRNAGMVVSCQHMTVEYRRFSYAPSASMTPEWKARKSADWNTTHCDSAVWKDAIAHGWKVILSETSADGGQATFMARCQ